MTKDDKFNIGLALNKIAMMLSDEDFHKVKDLLKQIERIVARQTENSSEKPNNCEDLQDWKDQMWAEAIVTEPTISKMEQVAKDINVRSKDEQTDCTEALALLWIKNMVTDEEFYRIDARLKCISCKWWNDTIVGGSECVSKECTYQPKDEPQTEREGE